MNRKFSILALATIIIAALSVTLVSAPKPLPELSDYSITYLSDSYDPIEDEHTWRYLVECLGDPEISHMDFTMNGNCDPTGNDVIRAAVYTYPGETLITDQYELVNPDPTTGVIGLKFDIGVKVGETVILEFVLKGMWDSEGTIEFTVKAGNEPAPGQDWPKYYPKGPDCMGKIIVKKVIDWGINSQYMNDFYFDFLFDGSIAFSLGDDEEEIFNVLPGTYPVEEDSPPGWETQVKINDGAAVPGSSTSVTVGAGETVVVVFINRPPDFKIPENPVGTIATLLPLLIAALAYYYKKGLIVFTS
jgi:hypothetical protein